MASNLQNIANKSAFEEEYRSSGVPNKLKDLSETSTLPVWSFVANMSTEEEKKKNQSTVQDQGLTIC